MSFPELAPCDAHRDLDRFRLIDMRQSHVKACEVLQKMGIRDVTNLAGGMIAWNQAGLPIVRAEPRALEELLTCTVYW